MGKLNRNFMDIFDIAIYLGLKYNFLKKLCKLNLILFKRMKITSL